MGNTKKAVVSSVKTIDTLIERMVTGAYKLAFNLLDFAVSDGWKDTSRNGLNDPSTSYSGWTKDYFGPDKSNTKLTAKSAQNYAGTARAWTAAGIDAVSCGILLDGPRLDGADNVTEMIRSHKDTTEEEILSCGLALTIDNTLEASYREEFGKSIKAVAWHNMVTSAKYLRPAKGSESEKNLEAKMRGIRILCYMQSPTFGSQQDFVAWLKSEYRSAEPPSSGDNADPDETIATTPEGIGRIIRAHTEVTSYSNVIAEVIKAMGGAKVFWEHCPESEKGLLTSYALEEEKKDMISAERQFRKDASEDENGQTQSKSTTLQI